MNDTPLSNSKTTLDINTERAIRVNEELAAAKELVSDFWKEMRSKHTKEEVLSIRISLKKLAETDAHRLLHEAAEEISEATLRRLKAAELP